jgi:hypothetical protein
MTDERYDQLTDDIQRIVESRAGDIMDDLVSEVDNTLDDVNENGNDFFEQIKETLKENI